MFGSTSLQSAVYMIKRTADSTQPCGTPVLIPITLDIVSLKCTYCLLLLKKLWIHGIRFTFTFMFINFFSSVSDYIYMCVYVYVRLRVRICGFKIADGWMCQRGCSRMCLLVYVCVLVWAIWPPKSWTWGSILGWSVQDLKQSGWSRCELTTIYDPENLSKVPIWLLI